MASNLERRSASERLGATPAGGRCSGRRRIRPVAAAHRSEPLLVLWFTKLDKVFTYGIVVMQGSRFAHLGMVVDGSGGWRRRGDSAQAQRRWWRAPRLLRLNRGHQHGHRSLLIISGRLIWHGWRHTGAAVSETRWLGFQSLRVKIRRRTRTIYMAFCTDHRRQRF
jgi:hypothetical protein